MNGRITQAMSPAALMVSILALVAAVSFSAYAATLARNSVGTQHLKKGAVTSAKVKDGSLRAVDFRGGLPAGPRGLQGPTGPPGAQGPTGPPGAQGPAGTARSIAAVHGSGVFQTEPQGFATVSRIGVGEYCLGPAGAGDVLLVSAGIGGGGAGSAVWTGICTEGRGFWVRTYSLAGSPQDTGFTALVP